MGVENGSTWSAYTGTAALILAAVLLVIGCALAYLGTQLDHPLKARQPGKALGVSLVLIWVLAVASLLISVGVYGLAMYKQVGHVVTLPPDRIAPITALSGLVSFIVIAVLARRQGFKVAIGSAIVGTIAAPLIFEFPYDLIVMTRTYPPTPEVVFRLLFFLPLFLVEIISFMMLTLSPLTSLSRYTLYSLAAMFLVFAFWAFFGFSFPSTALPFASNAVSKVLAFVTAITLFLPQKGITTK